MSPIETTFQVYKDNKRILKEAHTADEIHERISQLELSLHTPEELNEFIQKVSKERLSDGGYTGIFLSRLAQNSFSQHKRFRFNISTPHHHLCSYLVGGESLDTLLVFDSDVGSAQATRAERIAIVNYKNVGDKQAKKARHVAILNCGNVGADQAVGASNSVFLNLGEVGESSYKGTNNCTFYFSDQRIYNRVAEKINGKEGCKVIYDTNLESLAENEENIMEFLGEQPEAKSATQQRNALIGCAVIIVGFAGLLANVESDSSSKGSTSEVVDKTLTPDNMYAVYGAGMSRRDMYRKLRNEAMQDINAETPEYLGEIVFAESEANRKFLKILDHPDFRSIHWNSAQINEFLQKIGRDMRYGSGDLAIDILNKVIQYSYNNGMNDFDIDLYAVQLKYTADTEDRSHRSVGSGLRGRDESNLLKVIFRGDIGPFFMDGSVFCDAHHYSRDYGK